MVGLSTASIVVSVDMQSLTPSSRKIGMHNSSHAEEYPRTLDIATSAGVVEYLSERSPLKASRSSSASDERSSEYVWPGLQNPSEQCGTDAIGV